MPGVAALRVRCERAQLSCLAQRADPSAPGQVWSEYDVDVVALVFSLHCSSLDSCGLVGAGLGAKTSSR